MSRDSLHGWQVYACLHEMSYSCVAERMAHNFFRVEARIFDNAPERPSALWMEYQVIAAGARNFAMRRASQRDEIYPVFHELFRKESQ